MAPAKLVRSRCVKFGCRGEVIAPEGSFTTCPICREKLFVFAFETASERFHKHSLMVVICLVLFLGGPLWGLISALLWKNGQLLWANFFLGLSVVNLLAGAIVGALAWFRSRSKANSSQDTPDEMLKATTSLAKQSADGSCPSDTKAPPIKDSVQMLQPTLNVGDPGSLKPNTSGVKNLPQKKRLMVFVSHSTKDRSVIESKILSILRGCDVDVWYSSVSIESASEWERSILDGLNACDWFLLVMSSSSAKSEWVKDELHWAIQNRPGRIIPLSIEECDAHQFHIRLPRIQQIDFRKNSLEAKNRLEAVFKSSKR